MEFTQPCPFEAQGRKKPTHDFLSACSTNSSTMQLDPNPVPSSQGRYLKTHDFLQPLERVTRACVDTTTVSSEVKSHQVQNQHALPGGIGTYTISHIPYFYHQQGVPKPEMSQPILAVAEEHINSNCNAYAANGFTMWNESVGKKEKKRNENVPHRTNIRDATATMGQWQVMEQRSSFSSRSSSQTSGVKSQSQSFMDMIKSAKGSSQDEDLDDDDEEFVMKKENNTCPRVDLRVKVDGKGNGNEQKPNTPRSKHSATEQRRRSKINDRFQMLRRLIPNSDQKRDKASFLLEVIEYINFLQEKVNKHEVVPYQGELMNLRNHEQSSEGTVPVLSDAQAIDMDQQCLDRAMDTILGQRNSFFSPESSQLCPVLSDAALESEKLEEEEEEELCMNKGTINISSVYSQGLLKTLTETLQASGVDLSKASISVQIKLSNQPQKVEEVQRRVRPRSQSGDDNSSTQSRKQKKFKNDNNIRHI